jgi:Flp pilus assembly protein TadG
MAMTIQTLCGARSTRASLFSRGFLQFAKAQDEEGTAMFEFAWSASLLLSTIFGIMAISIALYSYTYVSDVTREATRYAIVRGNTFTTDCVTPGFATCTAQPADILAYIKGLGFPGINTSNVSASTTWLTSAGAACGTADTCKSPGNLVQVKVTYTYPLSIPFVSKRTLSLTSTSQMVISQ